MKLLSVENARFSSAKEFFKSFGGLVSLCWGHKLVQGIQLNKKQA